MQQRKSVVSRSGSLRSTGDPSLQVAAEVSSGAALDEDDRGRKSPPPVRKNSSSASTPRVSTAYAERYVGVTLSWILMFGGMVLLCIGGYHYLLEWEAQEELRITERLQREEVDPMTREWEEKLLELQQENADLHQKALHTAPSNKVETKEMVKKIGQLKAYKQQMHHAIQVVSRRYVLEKFGPGPHRVEIQLEFDPKSSIAGTADKFVVEMAPLELMPHALYTFLSQVDEGLYNGCSFHRNAGHVVQGGPAPNFASPPNARLRKKFVDLGLESIRFQEYSEKFPHEKYTLGFAGRPGGPDFYVSTRNNTRAHGPGGQSSYADPTEADPCFAKVVEGFEAVDRMAKSPVADRDYRHMEHNIAIRHMKLITEG